MMNWMDFLFELAAGDWQLTTPPSVLLEEADRCDRCDRWFMINCTRVCCLTRSGSFLFQQNSIRAETRRRQLPMCGGFYCHVGKAWFHTGEGRWGRWGGLHVLVKDLITCSRSWEEGEELHAVLSYSYFLNRCGVTACCFVFLYGFISEMLVYKNDLEEFRPLFRWTVCSHKLSQKISNI